VPHDRSAAARSAGTFRGTFRLRANPTGTVTNGASVDIPTGSAPSPVPPDSAARPPDTAVLAETRRRVLSRDVAGIKVRRTVAPNFTG